MGEDREQRVSDPAIGLVLSGGGANGAYEVGVMKALFAGASPGTGYRPIDPEIFTGTSTGAFNAALMVGRDAPAPEALAYLEAVWLDTIADTLVNCGNGVFRIRGLPLQLFDPGCLTHPLRTALELGKDWAELGVFGALKGAQFATSHSSLQSRLISLVDISAFISETPFLRLIHDQVDIPGLARSRKRLTVVASNWASGRVRYFGRQEIAQRVGAAAITASASIPGLFRPTEIEGQPYVDGGVLANTPFRPALLAGAREIHAVLLDPLIPDIELPRLPSTADVVYLMLAIIWAQRLREDARRAAAVNATLRWIASQETGPEGPGETDDDAARFLEYGGRALERLREGRPYHPLTVHIYRPASALGAGEGLLDFDRRRLTDLIDLGYRDAARHDCAVEGCVRVGRPEEAAA